jgi:hypothetical protein
MLTKAIEKLESIEFFLSIPGHLGILADAQRQQGDLEGAKKSCARALSLIADGGDRWIEPEVHRVDALIESDMGRLDRTKIEAKFLDSIECAKKMGCPIFELRGLVSLKNFLGTSRQDIEVESRIKQLSYLQNLDRRVDAAIKARGNKLCATEH